ncbi:HDOD domain protein [Caulifigura coniformis]|uniref:HDOD domain protein n=1 Tax=Caulifigura coniformis TaxID=2527983 RepID=A0A517SDI0_9PLAN|nr:HDOD domain-containing protein [Caulifigura coniformis]QDT54183.1 HDOD domain protein [Caulifigura coniformis]
MSTGRATVGLEISNSLIEHLRRGVGRLQMLPPLAKEAMEIVNTDDCDLLKVASIIQRDVKLATFILRVANSTAFSPPKPIASLNHAVLFIGRRRARDFIITASLMALSNTVPASLHTRQATLASHGFLTAVMATKINHLLKLGFDGEEFTAGLMHDFGRTLMMIADPVNTPHIDPLDFNEPVGIEGRERLHLGASHAEIGAWFAATNELPDSLVSAIRFHHAPEEAGDGLMMAALISAADHAVNDMQRSDARAGYDPATNRGILLLEQSGVPDASGRFASAIDVLRKDVVEAAQSFQS